MKVSHLQEVCWRWEICVKFWSHTHTDSQTHLLLSTRGWVRAKFTWWQWLHLQKISSWNPVSNVSVFQNANKMDKTHQKFLFFISRGKSGNFKNFKRSSWFSLIWTETTTSFIWDKFLVHNTFHTCYLWSDQIENLDTVLNKQGVKHNLRSTGPDVSKWLWHPTSL